MRLETEITKLLNIEHPIISAPMARVSGAELAAAVSGAGGFGLLGGGYCDSAWIRQELDALRGKRFGVGAITWALDKEPSVLDIILSYGPEAVFLSFGDPEPYVEKIHQAGAKVITQVQTVAGARDAAAKGADIIVAQGTEAGGHCGTRATLPLVAAVVDALPDTPIMAAGGIADGRGLAAALMLGAQGVVCGTAFCPAEESLAHRAAKERMGQASGDETLRGETFDIIRGFDWPNSWKLRTLKNDFSDQWHADPAGLRDNVAALESDYVAAFEGGDFDQAAIVIGEAVDLIQEIRPAEEILQSIVREAGTRLNTAASFVA